MTRAGSLLFAIVLAGCSGDGEAQGVVELSIQAESHTGLRGEVTCEPLPLQHGSRRLTEHVVDDAFTITVMSSPSEARLSFREGARTLAQELVISRTALENDYAEELTLLLDGGESYVVSVGAECAP